MNFLKVNHEGSRFRVLMAAQLNAAAGESPVTAPPFQPSEDQSEDQSEVSPSAPSQ